MALIFCDSFEHYDNNQRANKWSQILNAPGITGITGRFGGGFQSGASSSGNNALQLSGLGNQATWIAGTALQIASRASTTMPVLTFRDTLQDQCELRVDTLNRLVVTRDATVLATGTTALTDNVWYYIEFKVTIGNTGTYEVHINGVQEAALTSGSADTQATANAFANAFIFSKYEGGGGGDWRQDDLYLCDGTGGTNNDFLGDVRVEALFPNGNGNSSVFVGSDGNSVDNYLLVDETVPNSDTDYVQGTSVGDKDTYTFTNPTPTSGTVFGVQVLQFARKTDAGARSICSVARLSGTEVDSANFALATTYTYYRDVRETKPGGGAWSLTDVSNAEFGPKVTV